ncbi:hypothetical protein BCR34DRAFT_587342 [Clohesyomyces aquaticus]|uniref:Uncharacterized protein n=1 Tax=Clohesyomyces aquaticus TaxID=1231657 RepID=A0A1Y1ZPM0_9PLEO|nr:hypothetical protein BCR34DRAFT_587342 [Clohesyomyces aquaticus]
MSGKIFHELLLERLNAAAIDDPTNSSEMKPPQCARSLESFPPTMEKLVDVSVSPLFLLNASRKENRPASKFIRATQAQWSPIRTSPYKTRFRCFSVENVTPSSIPLACRGHGTTLTGRLHGLVLILLEALLGGTQASAFASNKAIDQQRHLPSGRPTYSSFQPTTAFGNYVSMMDHRFNSAVVSQIRSMVGEKDHAESLSTGLMEIVWTTSLKVRKAIEEKLSMSLRNDILGLAKDIPDFREKFKMMQRRPASVPG